MAFATTVKTPIAYSPYSCRWVCSPCDRTDPRYSRWFEVKRRPDQEILLEEGEFQIDGPHGTRYIGVFTGRTRAIGGGRCPTVEVYDIDTVVEMVGDLPVIVGRRGQRISGGTWYTSPQAKANA